MSKIILFSSTFKVERMDDSRFDKVARFYCTSQGTNLFVDINVDVYPVQKNNELVVTFASTILKNGAPVPDTYDPTLFEQETLADDYEYVMYGKVFKFINGSDKNVSIVMSFGGLLAVLQGDAALFKDIELNSSIFLLAKKS